MNFLALKPSWEKFRTNHPKMISFVKTASRESFLDEGSLIEDLFEVSKAANGTVVLHPEEVDVVSLLKQVRFELSDKIEASGIQFHFDLPNERLAASLDGQKTCRIFENLLVNITKYGMKGTRAYIKAEKDGEYVQVTLRNISAEELKISPEELTERGRRCFEAGDRC